ncbi:MAG TPA: hypothetical protein VGX28_01995 [Frankiaceae bacterium]|nr:hypothetical protein [Frankiaceae bacterium]
MSRPAASRARRGAVAVAATALALAACGSDGGKSSVLSETARNLGDIRSATLDLKMTAESPAAKGPVGFSMRGPFALPEKKAGLPVANLVVSELRGADTTTVSFVSTGDKAYVVRDGKATPLASPAVSVGGGGEGGLGELRIDQWLHDPKETAGGTVNGVQTDKVEAGLDVVAAFDDLGKLGQRLGSSALAGLKPLDDRSREALRKAATDSRVQVWSGNDDRLLRRLVLRVTLTASGDLPEALRAMAPVTLSLSLDLAKVNEPVHVDPPAT